MCAAVRHIACLDLAFFGVVTVWVPVQLIPVSFAATISLMRGANQRGFAIFINVSTAIDTPSLLRQQE